MSGESFLDSNGRSWRCCGGFPAAKFRDGHRLSRESWHGPSNSKSVYLDGEEVVFCRLDTTNGSESFGSGVLSIIDKTAGDWLVLCEEGAMASSEHLTARVGTKDDQPELF